jgi:1-pyrroline-5-carboxylate dehydrogenase
MATQVNYASSSLGDDELEHRFEEALAALRATPSPVEPQLIGAHEIREGLIVGRFDPCVPGARVAAAHEASPEHVAAAVAAARAQTKSWRNTPYAERIARLRAARDVAAGRIIDLAAIVSARPARPASRRSARRRKCWT